MVKKIPMRMCVVTREKYPKLELFRIVKFDNNIFLDTTGKANGKGCYLKKDLEVISKAKKTKILNKIFECEVKDEIYDEMINLIK